MLLLMLTAREGRLSIRRQRFAHPANCRATPQIAARDRTRVPRRRRRRSPQRQNRRKRRSFKPALTLLGLGRNSLIEVWEPEVRLGPSPVAGRFGERQRASRPAELLLLRLGLILAWSDPVNNSITSTSVWIRQDSALSNLEETIQII